MCKHGLHIWSRTKTASNRSREEQQNLSNGLRNWHTQTDLNSWEYVRWRNGDSAETWLRCTRYLTKRKEWTKPNFFQPALDTHGLRGHSQKLFKPRYRTTTRTTFFSNRIIDEWNRLPQYVIDSSSVNVFKNRLDETWEDMGTYSWKATSLINYKYKYKYMYCWVSVLATR